LCDEKKHNYICEKVVNHDDNLFEHVSLLFIDINELKDECLDFLSKGMLSFPVQSPYVHYENSLIILEIIFKSKSSSLLLFFSLIFSLIQIIYKVKNFFNIFGY